MIAGFDKDKNGKITDIHFIGGGTIEEKEKIIKELKNNGEEQQ